MTTLKQVRKRLGIGLREFARLAGVNKDVVLRIEKRSVKPQDVSHGDIVRMSRALEGLGLAREVIDVVFPVPVTSASKAA